MAKTKKRTTKKTTKAKTAKKKATPKAKKADAKKANAKKTEAKKAKEKEVTVDRRRKQRRTKNETVQEEVVVQAAPDPKPERREKVQRRRQIDPTTCERDYTDHEIEFMHALDAYKRANGRMFPTCSEILEVIRGLGYEKKMPEEEQPAADANSPEQATDAVPAENDENVLLTDSSEENSEPLMAPLLESSDESDPTGSLDDQLRNIETNSLFS